MSNSSYQSPNRTRLSGKAYEHTILESFSSLAVVVVGLVAIGAYCPLSNPGFKYVCIAISCLCLAYAIYKIVRDKRVAQWWGLPFCSGLRNPDFLSPHEADTVSCSTLLAIFGISFLPAIFARCAVGGFGLLPGVYLPWCVVQDFLFFAVVFRSATVLFGVWPAALLGAVAFGASHYPLYPLAALSAAAYLLWAYLYVVSGSLALVIICHFVLGMIVLG